MAKEYKVWLHVEVNNGPNAEDFADAIVEYAALQLAGCDKPEPRPHKLKRK